MRCRHRWAYVPMMPARGFSAFFQEAARAMAQERAHDGLHDDSGSWFQLCRHLSISRKALACKSTTMMNVQHTIGGV